MDKNSCVCFLFMLFWFFTFYVLCFHFLIVVVCCNITSSIKVVFTNKSKRLVCSKGWWCAHERVTSRYKIKRKLEATDVLPNTDRRKGQNAVFCPWWPWPLTVKLSQARDQTRFPCEFGAYPFSNSRDISHKQKSHRLTAPKTEPSAVHWVHY